LPHFVDFKYPKGEVIHLLAQEALSLLIPLLGSHAQTLSRVNEVALNTLFMIDQKVCFYGSLGLP
jgi:hypothetical protein